MSKHIDRCFVAARRLAPVALALTLTSLGAGAAEWDLTLSGSQEVPPVTSTASATAHVVVGDDGSVSGGMQVTGFTGTMAHIHAGEAGKNGPVLVKMEPSGNGFVFPKGAKLTPEQMNDLREGKLYVNVHSEAHPSGELRAQLK